MIKIIYFDFGNVLVTYDKVFTKVCRDSNLDNEKFWEYYSRFQKELTVGEMRTETFWKKFSDDYGLDLHKFKNYDFAKSWVSDYEIIQPIYDLVCELDKKFLIGIISNINSGIWEAALKHNWVPNIDYKKVILSCEVGIKKPEREIYEIAQKESGVKPEEILFIDDREENLIEPKKMNWKVVCFDPSKAEEGVKKIREIIE